MADDSDNNIDYFTTFLDDMGPAPAGKAILSFMHYEEEQPVHIGKILDKLGDSFDPDSLIDSIMLLQSLTYITSDDDTMFALTKKGASSVSQNG